MQEIRKVEKKDLEGLKEVLDSIELFPSELLEDMISDYLTNPTSSDIWFTTVADGRPVSIGFCAPEKLTDGTYNLYAIGVKRNLQGKGLGTKMMGYLEDQLKQQGQRILIVETSSLPDFAATREFYKNLHFAKEAVIRDFWEEGDDKVIFWKKLH